MAEKSVWPQQPVISIRISEALRLRLERLKEILSHKTGETVSTSEAAKQLLESAREDRLEVAELLANPTNCLQQARRKVETGFSLGRAEWIVVAHYAYRGVESTVGRPVSRETLQGILTAFLAAYKIRRPRKKSLDAHYLAQLPILDEEGNDFLGAEDVDLPTAVERLIRQLDTPDMFLWPQFAARILYELLEEEEFGIEALNRVLKPHWPVLWRAAARGHYLVLQTPVRASATSTPSHPWGPAISSVFEGGFVLSFAVGGNGDLSLLLSLPQDRQAMYEMGPYPMIAEFCAMLEEWDTSYPNSHWQGRWFLGYTAMEQTVPPVWIRCQGSVSFGFRAAEWRSLQEAFRRAWAMPELQRVWNELTLQYGEL
jgi:hypothetical protein